MQDNIINAFAEQAKTMYAPLTKFNELMVENMEKMTEFQLNTIKSYAELSIDQMKKAVEVKDVESFNAKIGENNIQRRSAILSENDNTVQGLNASRDIARWANDAEEGSVSEAFDVDEAFVVAIVEAVDKKGTAPLEKVRNRVEFLARQKKKAEILKQEMSGATNIGELAGKLGLSVEKAEWSFTNDGIE